MATIPCWTPTTIELTKSQRSWSDHEKSEWLAAHGGVPTHVVTFEPMYQVELCIPPWEQPERQIARSAVTWGERMRCAFDADGDAAAAVVAAHHEGNSMEVHIAVQPRPQPQPQLRAVD